MRRRNQQQILEEMQSVWRYNTDDNYKAACDNIPNDHWYHNNLSEEYFEYLAEWGRYQIMVSGRYQNECCYPFQFEAEQKPTDFAKKYLQLYIADSLSRYNLKKSIDGSEWRTFRDCEPSDYASIHTGTKAVPLKAKWMDLDDKGKISK